MTEEQIVDWSKPIRLRSGQRAELVRVLRCSDGKFNYWIVVYEHNNVQWMHMTNSSGQIYRWESPEDIINE